MYSTCLYCNNPLGRNEVIETFPVGRRLAFDQARGRLWVVCRKCEKWNLSPFEERWEAIEVCERHFHDARKRVSTDNIGLAKLSEGLELVRIGQPMRPEFAAWRYGDQFGRRQRRAILIGAGVAAVGGGVVVAGAMSGVLTGGGWGLWQLVNAGVTAARRKRRVAVVTAPSGQRLTVRGAHVERAHFIPPEDTGDRWGLSLPHEGGEAVLLYGEHARRATALIMPKVNAGGASRRRVQDAVQRIERVGDPGRFLEQLAGTAPRTSQRLVEVEGSWWRGERWDGGWGSRRAKGKPAMGLTGLELETRLAIEMAVNEEHERAALEGELALLELEWKDAEEIAAIADRLGMPEEVDAQLEDLRRRNAPGTT
ncbi:MAG TPA: hypothetical protein VLE53_10910 [Gemmatimonadaceae bacterium]|nr:hypothetical protein [Gemmatimonadaceae bacterium]